MHSPNRLSLHHLHMARFTIEAESGFSLASGLTNVKFDNLVVRDANGLPAIPGTSLAGVIRNQYEKHYMSTTSEDRLNLARLFGDHLKKSKAVETEESIKSRVEFSWGIVHNSENVPVEGLHTVQEEDVFLKFLQQDHPIVRDRVRINESGCADHQAKFDKTTIPRGVRFSAEMALWSDEAEPIEWMQLCHLVAEQPMRLGGSAGVGMGLFKCLSINCRSFDLTKPDDYDKFASLDPSLSKALPDDWKAFESDDEKLSKYKRRPNTKISISLDAEDLWRIGQGEAPLRQSDNPPDLRPYYEPVVVWHHDKAKLEPASFVVPGTSIKGALRHRFTFHYARQLLPLDDLGEPSVSAAEAGNSSSAEDRRMCRIRELSVEATEHLFGSVADTSNKKPENSEDTVDDSDTDENAFTSEAAGANAKGHRTRLLVSDARLGSIPGDNELFHMTHTSIDRFTGGVRHGALYSEELIWLNSMTIDLELLHDAFEDLPDGLKGEYLKKALELTLDDLTQGRLALGGGSAKGHGYFSGSVKTEQAGRAEEEREQEVA